MEVFKSYFKDLEALNFRVEKNKLTNDKIKSASLFGINNQIDKFFDAQMQLVQMENSSEVEAGRVIGITNF